MKGTLFQKPLEFNLEVPGETWSQGDALKGQLSVKNHGQEKVSLDTYGVALALGNMKKVKARDEKALDIAESKLFEGISVASGQSVKLDFDFTLLSNGPITDKTNSPYLVYGDLQKREGHLQLTVEPSKTFKPLLSVLDVFFRFKLKDRKHTKDSVEFKLIAPDAKDFKAMESMTLKLKETDDMGIEMKIQFQMKNVGITDGAVAVKKSKIAKNMNLKFSDYMFQKDSPNQEAIRKLFQGLFDETLPKQLF